MGLILSVTLEQGLWTMRKARRAHRAAKSGLPFRTWARAALAGGRSGKVCAIAPAVSGVQAAS